MEKNKLITLPIEMEGELEKTGDRVVVNSMTLEQLEVFLKSIASQEGVFKLLNERVSVCVVQEPAQKVRLDVSELQYKTLCSFYFKNRAEEYQNEI